MPDRDLSEAQARALWERAARLHAESAARQLSSGSDDDEAESLKKGPGDGSYSVDVVVRSAVEAGIPAEFVEQALTEMGPGAEEQGTVDLWAEKYLNDDTPTISTHRVIHSPVEEVYAAMQRVYPNAPFGLTLAGTDGRPPLEGGVLTFEIPYALTGLQGGTAVNKAMTDLRHWADIKEIRVRLRPVADDASRTEMQIWASLANTRRVNFWAGNGIGGMIGLVAALMTGAITSSIINPAVAAEILTTFGAAGAAGGTTFLTSRLWWRPLYKLALRRGKGGMERLIDALVVDLQTGGGFTRRIEPGAKSGDPVSNILGDLGLQ